MYKVAVLMSSYNGELYIKEQINSVLSQKQVQVDLFIRDDGSSDKTIEIIKEFPGIHLYRGENLGVGNSFMDLLYNVDGDYDYYAFCDQDDIWLDNKLITAIYKIKYETGPILYCSNQILVDKFGEEIGNRYTEVPDLSYAEILVHNHATGCTMVWNKQLHNILKSNKPSHTLLKIRIHDVWVAMVASVCGKIIYDEDGYILYRQHENNVVGAKQDNSIDVLKNQIKKVKRRELRNGRSLLAKEILKLFPIECMEKILLHLAADSKSFNGKIRLIKRRGEFTKHSGENSIAFVIKVIVGLF